MEKLQKAAEADHTDADCFVCVFLSHGEGSHVFARDDKVDIKEIIALFRGDQCKSLVGKPKIFIFQACRGDITDNAVTGMALDEMSSEVEEDAASIYTLPAGADFLMCYCVTEGLLANYFSRDDEGQCGGITASSGAVVVPGPHKETMSRQVIECRLGGLVAVCPVECGRRRLTKLAITDQAISANLSASTSSESHTVMSTRCWFRRSYSSFSASFLFSSCVALSFFFRSLSRYSLYCDLAEAAEARSSLAKGWWNPTTGNYLVTD
ncbi:hypothetical protein MHYP_G00044440 [Metynnis hypsauchen]